MADTRIKAGQFFGVVGHGTDGYFLMTNADGTMSWAEGGASGPSVTSVDYPGDDTAADPAGGQTVVLTGTGFATSGMTVSIGGTTAPSVAHDSNTQLTITTPAKAAGDYDIVVTNTVTGASGTFVNGISYNGIPTWTTAAGSLGTFESETTISTITLQATEPDGGTITFNITNGALPTGLSLTGANIDGTTTAESSTTLYSFTIEAIDDENQATPRNFSITVNSSAIISSENFTINTYTGNGSTQSIEGKIGTAASFNGSSSYIETGISSLTNNFTFSAWLYADDLTPSYRWIFGNWYSSTQDIYLTINNGGVIEFNPDGNNGTVVFGSAGDFTLNTWHHLVVSMNAGTYTVYLDNTSLGSGTTTNTTFNNGYNYQLGKTPKSGINQWSGKIDQVRIFNKGISSSEVTTLYGENNASSTKSTTDIFDDGSGVALYEFEEGAKDTGGVNGYIGSSGIFNGSSSKITSPYTSTSQITTISMWVNVVNISTTREYFTDSTNRWIISNGSGTSSNLSIFDGSTWIATGTDLTANTWQHICVVRDGNNATVYLDGNSIYTTSSADSDSIGSSLTLGAGYTGGNEFEGKIDQVRIFDKAISSSEVTTLYGETSASATKSATDIFDDGSGVALYELEGNANDSGRFGSGAIDSGQSAVFNGTNSALSANRMFSTASSYSISFWAKMAAGTTTENCYFWQISGVTQRALMVNYSGSGTNYTFTFNHKGATNNGTASAVTFVPDGNWHHFTGTFNSSTSTGSLYIDGVEKNTFTLDPVLDTGNTLYMGGNYVYNGVQYYVPLSGLDQIRIYDTALSASDVEALVSETNVPTANLVAHYKLDGNANDSVGSYNGTATSITYSDTAEYPKYDGTATNVSYGYDGTPTNVSFVGTSFQPDLVWVKSRSLGASNGIFDSVRGVANWLRSDGTNAEQYQRVNGYVNSFDSNGFTLAEGSSTDPTYTGSYETHQSGQTYVAWCWKAGGTAVSNTDGSITSSVSANPDAGFSIVKWAGNNTAGATIGHGLSSAPEMIIIKNYSQPIAQRWVIGHNNMDSSSPWNYYLEFDTDARAINNARSFNGTAPTSSVFSVGNDSQVNADDMIAYCFHSVDGYQKVGSYLGNGSASGPTITLGFTPRFVMIKATENVSDWLMFDTVRDSVSPTTKILYANLSSAEQDGITDRSPDLYIEVTSNGFQIKGLNNDINVNGETFIYLAIA